mmetsp:Transcript_55892/g.76269  ORF Transcript_55892/g.76269 Transcript_55892/m.76269 type:complete len:81 (+) Transcript_55892:192-434(+)
MMTMLTAAFQDSGGVFEISQRMTSLLRWGATSDFQDDGVYNQAVESYVLDTEMANTLKEANPQAFGNILRRFREANGRGL